MDRAHRAPGAAADRGDGWDYRGALRPLRWLLLLWIGLIYLYTLLSHESRLTAPVELFSTLMLLHAGLHWCSLTWRLSPGPRWCYFGAQGVLVFILAVVAPGATVTAGLYSLLSAEAVGILPRRRAAAVVAAYLALFCGAVILGSGWKALPPALLGLAPLLLTTLGCVALFVREVRGRQEAQALLRELAAAQAEVAALTLAAERQRLARELHDTLAQGLAGLILQLEAADAHLEGERPGRARAIVQQAMQRARATLTEARRAIDDLRAAPASDLAAAVQEEAARFTATTGVPCAVDVRPPAAISAAQAEHARRAITEALANTARHAGARQAWVLLATCDGLLDIEVRDDGVGFEPATIATAGHYGLLGLRERARLAGGDLQIVSTPGRGTTVRLRFPATGEQNGA